MVFPGFRQNYITQYINIIGKFLQYRKGCVCVADYRSYTLNDEEAGFDYVSVVTKDFAKIAEIINQKVTQIGNFSRFMFYGMSLGSRMAIEVGATLTGGKVGMIDACDPAGPGFDSIVHSDFPNVTANLILARNPQDAAVNVQCIHTSNTYGTAEYNCHQNWRMGLNCGNWQYLQPSTKGSRESDHVACETIYNNAFTSMFIPSSTLGTNCSSTRAVNLTSACAGARMGFWRGYDTANCVGDFFAKIL
jgi:Lipase